MDEHIKRFWVALIGGILMFSPLIVEDMVERGEKKARHAARQAYINANRTTITAKILEDHVYSLWGPDGYEADVMCNERLLKVRYLTNDEEAHALAGLSRDGVDQIVATGYLEPESNLIFQAENIRLIPS